MELLLLIVLMLMGGFIGSPFWWFDEARSFSWDLPPLASRMLAAAGWSFFVLGVLVLAHPTGRRLRLTVLLLFVYLALLFTDSGPFDLIWVWPGDLLTSRLIGVMLLTIAAGSLYSLPAIGTARPMLVMITVYALGLSLATLWNALAGKPVKMSYAVVFGGIFIVSGILLLLDWKSRGRLTENWELTDH